MDATRRISTLRRVATMASLSALILLPAGQAEAKKKPKSPVITKVTPKRADVGDKLTIKGRHFRKGMRKNSVGFKASGQSVVFVRSSLSTKKTMTVTVSRRLEKVMDGPTTFRLRVLARRFGKRYTPKRLSPTIMPRPGSTRPSDSPASPDQPNPSVPQTDPTPAACVAGAGDQDGDLLSDDLEAKTLGTSACNPDTDGDGSRDGFEYKSAVDLNDDEYQSPNTVLPFPAKRPYPNPLFADAGADFDGDSLTNGQEHLLWRYTVTERGKPATLFPLGYSDGMQFSVHSIDGSGRRRPALPASDYDRLLSPGNGSVPACNDVQNANRSSDGFKPWAERCGYGTVEVYDYATWTHFAGGSPFSEGINAYSLFDRDRTGTLTDAEVFTYDFDDNGVLSDDERDEDADGLSNYVEANGPLSDPTWWASCYAGEGPFPIAHAGTDIVDADSDGDGVRDGADDQDNDDVPNLMEVSRFLASGAFDGVGGTTCKEPETEEDPEDPAEDQPKVNHPSAYGRVNPFNPCLPDPNSRTCPRHLELDGEPFAPFDDSVNWLSLN